MIAYFKTSLLLTLGGLLLVWFHTQSWGLISITCLLLLLEISLSFDNAVINAKVLARMSPAWQKRFLVWGILIAVFGMRLVFPILVVALTSNQTILEVLHLALYQRELYSQALEQGLPTIAAFGGGFLIMVSLEFFLDPELKVYWITPLEKMIRLFLKYPGGLLIATTLCTLIFCFFYTDALLRIAFILGVTSQYGLHTLSHYLENRMAASNKNSLLSSGFVGFLYLEVLDASFSFDGVVGAFALTDDLIVIMIGLGVGAFFVRSITLYLVDHRAISRIRYLEHGAHYAVLSLAIVMVLKINLHLPEWIIGSISAIFIATSIIHSWIEKNRTLHTCK